MDLAQRGIGAPQIEAALAAGPDWVARAREVRGRRFGLTLPESWAEKAKQGTFFAVPGLFIGSYPVGPRPRF